MDLTRRDRAPLEIVDNALQMRLPLTDDELELHAALTSVAAGKTVEWSTLRNLVGAGFAYATTERLAVTEEGRTFLAQLVAPVADGPSAKIPDGSSNPGCQQGLTLDIPAFLKRGADNVQPFTSRDASRDLR
jgi:hypothetical protein